MFISHLRQKVPFFLRAFISINRSGDAGVLFTKLNATPDIATAQVGGIEAAHNDGALLTTAICLGHLGMSRLLAFNSAGQHASTSQLGVQ